MEENFLNVLTLTNEVLPLLFVFPLITDTLLCHDDELEGRRIAYIIYLVNSWSQEDGGTLDLFNVDGKTIICNLKYCI